MIKPILALLAVSFSLTVGAQDYPSRAIKMVIPFAPGSATDILGRVIAKELTDKLGQPVIVETKPGAGTAVAASYVSNSAPDGYTLLLGTNATFAVNPILYKKLPYNPADFKMVAAAGGMPSFLLVGGSSKYKTFGEFVKAAKEHPGKLTFGSSGVGSTGHLVGKVLENAAGIELLHVPYKDGPLGLTATITGEVDAIFYTSIAAMAMIKAERVRPLAVSTAKRTVELPNVPTIAESGITGFDLSGWVVLAAPARTPQPIVEKLRLAMLELYALPAYQEKLESIGMVTQKLTGKELDAFVKQEQTRMLDVAKRSNIQPE